jgi:hypothetical protein
VKKSFKKDFIIIFFGGKIGFKRNYLKRTGARQRCDWLAQWKNRSRRWASVGRGNETGREK